jgi:DNA-binding MarR family transcriptional regulator
MAELHPALLMFIGWRHVEARVLEAVTAAGHGLTLAQARLVARIGEHGSRLTDLAEQAQVTKQSAGFLVDQLERAGYVERVADPSDARARLIRISESGMQVCAIARKVERDVLREWRRHLGAERFAAMQEGLVALREIADPYRE